MATDDLSRSASGFTRHYTGVRMQQGRVLTDDDYNAGQRVLAEEARSRTSDIIGPAGSPDAGFRIVDPQFGSDGIDFKIQAGRMYLGGLRLDMLHEERFREQSDWLNQPAPEEPEPGTVDLVYLEAWRQSVSAVEDGELLEPGLGGPDTTNRIRTMKRVKIHPKVATSKCAEAWDIFQSHLGSMGLGFVGTDALLASDSRLRVTYDEPSVTDNLCQPAIAGGYLGADNQTIRVTLVDDSHFAWGFNNAFQLFRVNVDSDRRTLTLLTAPKDPSLWPRAGQVVEILPWSAVLDNGEKLAEEAEPGFFARLTSDYDPDSGEVTLGMTIPAGFGEEYASRSDAAELLTTQFGEDEQTPYLFLRVWDRGADTTSDPLILIPAGPEVLGTTGVAVEFLGPDRVPGDHWVLSVRPQTPDQIWPWELEVGKEAEGYHRYYTPLALIRWDGTPENLTGTVLTDCRKTFRPLTEIRGCCTATVGDGTESHGDFTKIQEAIESLPQEGGRVCIRPGTYTEAVSIEGKRNVILEGCGLQTRWTAPDDAQAVLTMLGCSHIAVSDMALRHPTAPSILAFGLKEGEGLHLRDLALVGRSQVVLLSWGVRDLRVERCNVLVHRLEKPTDPGSGEGVLPAVILQAEGLRVADSEIVTQRATAGSLPFGGMLIGGGSRNVRIVNNRIAGGSGNGITLGHVLYIPEDQYGQWDIVDWSAFQISWLAGHFEMDEKGCWIWVPNPPPPQDDPEAPPLVPVSGGDLRNVHILDNKIQFMGANGISVARFFDLSTHPDAIAVHNLHIERNLIAQCLRMGRQIYDPALQDVAAYGGIALATGENLRILNNTIVDNGFSHEEPVCGIFILSGESVEIGENRIKGNGPRTERLGALKPGWRGGVVLPLVRPIAEAPIAEKLPFARFDGIPAAIVYDNRIAALEGRAVDIKAIGPVVVQANQLSSHGSDLRELFAGFASGGDPTGLSNKEPTATSGVLGNVLKALNGTVVSIANLGMSAELYLQFFGAGGQLGSDLWLDSDQTSKSDDVRLMANGNIQFNDNQVIFDAVDTRVTLGLSAVTLVSLDDVSVQANQIDCALFTDILFINTLALGWSVRCTNNRFKEGVRNALLSAATFGLFNQTNDNQGTHCFFAAGLTDLSTIGNNRSLTGAFPALGPGGEGCAKWVEMSKSIQSQLDSVFEKLSG